MIRLAALILLGVVGFWTLAFLLQRRIAFPGTSRQPARSASQVPPEVEQIWLETPSGSVEAWMIPSPASGPRPLLIFAHGNGELIDDWAAPLSRLADQGVHVLAVEYPGYGHSEGSPSRASIREVFTVAYDRVVARSDVDEGAVVPYGRSMGGGAAADLATDRPVAGLVLQSTFRSTMAMARSMGVPGFLVRDRYDVAGIVASFDGPVLLMHGPSDPVIPFDHAERIAEARSDLDVVRLPCGHNDCAGAWPEIVAEIVGFLEAEGLLD